MATGETNVADVGTEILFTQKVCWLRDQMGRRLMEERLSDGERLDYLFTLLASRPAQDSEREACMRLLHDIRQRYRQTPEDVDALLGPEATVETPHASARLNHAAWTQVAATVMASDAAILLY